MNVLLSGTDDIVTDSGQTIGSATPQSVMPASYTNATVTYCEITTKKLYSQTRFTVFYD